jgi:hypothetical protein
LIEVTSIGMRGIMGLRRHHSDRVFDHFNRYPIVISQLPRRLSSPESIPYDRYAHASSRQCCLTKPKLGRYHDNGAGCCAADDINPFAPTHVRTGLNGTRAYWATSARGYEVPIASIMGPGFLRHRQPHGAS